MDIRYHVLCKWMDQDLIVLECVNTTINKADHFTKLLSRVLFHRHIDYIMGHVPPEYSPAYECSTGQFNAPRVKMIPDLYTTKDTLPVVICDNLDAKIYRWLLEQHIYIPLTTAHLPTHIGQKLLLALIFPTIQFCILQHRILGGC